jgi:hypothetical protein
MGHPKSCEGAATRQDSTREIPRRITENVPSVPGSRFPDREGGANYH